MKRMITLVLTTAVLASCGGGQKDKNLADLKKDRAAIDEQIKKLEKAQPDTSRKITPVTAMEVQPTAFHGYVEVQSQIAGDENVLATAQMNGVVNSISVHPGQRVSKGQVLAVLDAASVEQQIKSQEAQLTFARTVYEKQQKLWAQNIGTEVQLLQSKANYESQLKQREATIAQRNMFRIVSPISGTVDQVNIKVGDIAMPGGGGTQGIRVVNDSKLKAEGNLGESYLGKVRTGDPVTLLFPDLNDSIQTRLTYVAQAVDPVSRAFTVQVMLGSNKKLHPNMSCKMRINNYTNSSVIIVPVTAIQNLQQGDVVFVAESNRAKAVMVTQGRNSNGMVEVLSGLKAGDRIITEGLEDLDDGEEIQVK